MNPTLSAPRLSFTAPLFFWLLIQLTALALAAARYPFAAGLARPIEQYALEEMLALQIVAAAMLFPFLLRDWRSTLALIVTSAPYLFLTRLLSPTPCTTLAILWTYLTLWLLTLALWRSALPPRLHLPAVAVANLLVLGIPTCHYIHAEFSAGPWPLWLTGASPLTAALALIAFPRPILWLWLPAILLLIAGAALQLTRAGFAGGTNSH